MKKCIYCRSDVSTDSVIDFCQRCGEAVFGQKMFNTIVSNMQEASQRGDLHQMES